MSLAKARALLGQFEADMGRPSNLPYLVEGLAQLSHVREDSTSPIEKGAALMLAVTYARKVGEKVDALLTREPNTHVETLDYWLCVFLEFRRAGFELPSQVAKINSTIASTRAKKSIEYLTEHEKKALREKMAAFIRDHKRTP